MPARHIVCAVAALLLSTSAFAANAPTIEKLTIIPPQTSNIPAPPALAKTFPDGFPQGLGSGVVIAGKDKDGALLLYAVGDRGPNADAPDYKTAQGTTAQPAKIFPAPDFTPSLAKLRVAHGTVEILEIKPLLTSEGKPISGRPLPQGAVGSTGETPLSAELQVLPNDATGLDPEGVAVDPTDGNVWLCDEYGPFLVKVDAKTGRILAKYGPGQGLPEILAKRQPNRGFEGLAVSADGKVFAAVQSILDVDGKVKASKSPFIRIVEFDPATRKTRTFAYPLDVDAYKKSADAKLGDLTAVSPTNLLTVEQGKSADNKMRNIIYAIDISKATDITDKKTADGKPLETVPNSAALEALGVTMAQKTKVADLRELGWTAEKAEGLSIAPDGKTLVITSDNDFGLHVKTENPATKTDGKTVTDPTDYQIAPDGQVFFEGKAVPTTFSIAPTSEKTELWIMTLPEAIR